MPGPSPSARPQRPRVLDELGRAKSLSAGPEDFRVLWGGRPEGAQTVLLGLGPEPERLPEFFPGLKLARYVECPELAAQFGQNLGDDWRGRIPAGCAEAGADEIPELVRGGARLILYAPGPRLFPAFWGPLLARVQMELFPSPPLPRPRLAWLPGDEGGLLRIELREALETLGYEVRLTGRAGADEYRLGLAQGECPELVLSVNFSGLGPQGEGCHLLRAAGARVAVWCVDNPLHLVSGLKSSFWLDLPLFVSNGWFVEPLRRLGAQSVRALPLAARARDLEAAPRQSSPAWADLGGRLAFVGRSAFPGKDGFFAGCALPEPLWAEAQALLAAGRPPDFGWWLERLGIAKLWPGAEVRQAGFCAEETGKAWRTQCLRRAQADLGLLTVFGDAGWQELLGGGDLRGFVDYYAALPDIAASAGCCLNLTNPLLPQGLTQRHFDTWAWGGLLLTDATPGLGLFPAELTREITFRMPADIAPRFRALASSPGLAADLRAAWRAELARAHTYGHRLAEMLELLDLPS